MGIKIEASELGLGDVIHLGGPGYMVATVKKIDEKGVHVIRPYIHADDVEYTGGILTYLGFEEFAIYPKTTVELVQKGRPTR